MLTCIKGFFKAWLDFKIGFHFKPTKTHNNLLHSPIFFNPWILRNPSVKEFDFQGREEAKAPAPNKNSNEINCDTLSNSDLLPVESSTPSRENIRKKRSRSEELLCLDDQSSNKGEIPENLGVKCDLDSKKQRMG